jgi:hypothetical protein
VGKDSAAGGIESAHIRDKVSDPMGVNNENPVGAQPVDIIFIIEDKTGLTPVGFNVPRRWFKAR